MPVNNLIQKLCQAHPHLRDRLRPIEFVHGDLLAQAGLPIEQAIFPASGLISLVVELAQGDRVEAAVVGLDGALGGAAIFGAKWHTCTALAQIRGRAWTISSRDLIDAANVSSEVRDLMFAQEQRLFVQTQQTAACNAKHTITRRLCTWLLRAHEAAGCGELLVTQESLAQMLGVQRASVSVLAGQLQELDIIEYRRGRVWIKDTAALAEHACECYAAVKLRSSLVMNCEASASSEFRCQSGVGAALSV